MQLQADLCSQHCKRKNYSVSGTFTDKKITGGTADRPALNAALDFLEQGDVLVVSSSDRLARDMMTSLVIRHAIESKGARIEYADGSMCTATPEGELFTNILAAFASYERSRTIFRTKAALKKKRESLRRTGGHIKIGWQADPEKPGFIKRNEKEIESIIFACHKRTESGWTSTEIAKNLNRYFGSLRGKPWTPRTVRKMIEKNMHWACPVCGTYPAGPAHP